MYWPQRLMISLAQRHRRRPTTRRDFRNGVCARTAYSRGVGVTLRALFFDLFQSHSSQKISRQSFFRSAFAILSQTHWIRAIN